MLVLKDALNTPDLPQGGVGTIGNYDGIHLGQRAILDQVVASARERGVVSVVVTFDPHPLSVLQPAAAPLRLTTERQKLALLEEAGIDVVALVRFTPEIAKMPAEQFVREFLQGGLELSEIRVGEDFVFGADRSGDLQLLKRIGTEMGFDLAGVEEVYLGGTRISSTRIRQAVKEGRVEDAAEMLGRPYSVVGNIVRGDRMGQRLGWPTANVDAENELVPAAGVYAGRALFDSLAGTFLCATNVGTRPTVYENFQQVVESHILDFHTDIYGERMEITFNKRLREEKLFPSVMALSAQIRQDVEVTREYFSTLERYQDQPASLEDEEVGTE